ncbi:MAG: HYR domain-containing protein, partial [Flavobacteriales bacterium]
MPDTHWQFHRWTKALAPLAFAALLPFTAKAQPTNWDWLKAHDLGGEEWIRDVVMDTLNNAVYVVGSYQTPTTASSMPFGLPASNSNSNDGFIAKLEPATGNTVWSKNFGGSGWDALYGVAIDNTGRVYVTGTTTGNLTVTILGTPTATPGQGGWDIFTAGLDPVNGTTIWAKVTGKDKDDVGYSIAANATGVFVHGTYKKGFSFAGSNLSNSGSSDDDKVFLLKYSAGGVEQWAVSGTGDDDILSERVAADAANVYIVGNSFDAEVKWKGPGGWSNDLTASNNYPMYVVAITNAGQPVWMKALDHPDGPMVACNAIALSCGSVIIGGNSHCTTVFPGFGTMLWSGTAPHDALFIASLSKVTGQTAWVRSATSPGTPDHVAQVFDISVNGQGQIYASGVFRDSLNLDDGTKTNTTGVDEDIFIARLTAAGQWQWVKTEVSPDGEYATGMAVDGGGRLFVAGSYINNISLSNLSAIGGTTSNMFVARISDATWALWSDNPSRWAAPRALCNAAGPQNLNNLLTPFGKSYLVGYSPATPAGITNPTNIIGSPDNPYALFTGSGANMVVDFGLTLVAGDNYVVRWRLNTTGTAYLQIEESSDGISWTAQPAPISITSATYVNTTVTSLTNTRYLRLTKTSAPASAQFRISSITCYTGTVLNGTWGGPNTTATGVFNPAGLSGPQAITYTVVDGTCSWSTTRSIYVTVPPAGTTTGPGEVCPNTNSGLLTIAGMVPYTSVVYWESSIDGGASWQQINSQNDTITFTNLGTNTLFHARLYTPGCPSIMSNDHLVLVQDIVPPTVSCPPSETFFLGAGQCTVTYEMPLIAYSDNCMGAVVAGQAILTPGPGGGTVQVDNVEYIDDDIPVVYGDTLTLPWGVHTFTDTISDTNGNSTVCNWTVTVVDNTIPVVTCVDTVQVLGDPSCTYLFPDLTIGMTVVDNCPVDTTQSYLAGVDTLYISGTWQVNVVDIGGNIGSCSSYVKLVDVLPPSITCPGNVSANTNDGCTATGVVLGTPIIDDNCGVASVSNNAPSAFPIGVTNVTWTVTDNSGLTATCVQSVTVSDNVLPSITCPANVGVNASPGACGAVVNYVPPTGSDNCAGATTSITEGLASGATFPIGVHTVGYTVTDAVDSTASCSFTVTVLAAPAPTLDYGFASICGDNGFVTPVGAAPAGGVFSSPTLGAALNSSTGVIDLSLIAASATHTITYAFGGPCPQSASTTLTIGLPPDAGDSFTVSLCSNNGNVDLFPLLGPDAETSGTWTGPGGSAFTGLYDPAVHGSGIYSYTVAGALPCANETETITVTEVSAPSAGTNGAMTVCSNGSAQGLLAHLGGSPANGGSWSGPSPVSNNTYDPANMDPGVYTYTVVGSAPCANASATVTVTENLAPVVSTGNYGPLCSNDAAITLTGTPAGGTWSGVGVTGNSFDPSVGTQTVTYTVTAGGCTNSKPTTITVNPAPAVSTGSYMPLCSNSAAINLTGSPAGGTWSGTGVTGNSFNPAAGTQTVAYTVTAGGCTNSASTTITVNPAPVVSTGSYGPLCSNGAAIALTGSPIGGTWSGVGVTGNSFDPSAGTQTVTYTVTAGGCTNSASTSITVNPAPAVSTGSYGPLCSNGAAITLSGSPAGGTWSGTGVTGNSFDPGTGTQTVTYTVTVGGCTKSATTAIVVNVAPNAGTGSTLSVCVGTEIDLDTLLTGADPGGVWSGGSDVITASASGIYTYTVNGIPGCGNSTAFVNLSVSAPIDPEFNYTQASYCMNDADPAPSIAGGLFSYSPAGLVIANDGVIDLDASTPGVTYNVIQTFTSGACITADTVQVTILAPPTITTGAYGPLCSNSAAIALTGSPVGGTWSGTGVTGNSFDPSAGTQTVTYTVTAGGCSNSASTTITVNPSPAVSTGSYGPLCSNSAAIALAGSPIGGTWSGVGVTGNSFDPSAGTQTVTYTVTAGGCTNSASTSITVNPAPNAGANTTLALCTTSGMTPLFPALVGAQAGGTWYKFIVPAWTVFNGTVDPSFYTGGGTFTYRYIVEGLPPCAKDTAFVTVTYYVAPTAGQAMPQSICSGGAVVLSDLLLGETTGGTWTNSANQVVSGIVSPTSTETYTYLVDGTAPCADATKDVTVTVIPSNTITDTESACDSYTWPVNNQTYAASGTYTEVIGCTTHELVLTINTSGTITDTESACDSYTWPVNSQTYAASGTYTQMVGCTTHELVLTITTSNTITD